MQKQAQKTVDPLMPAQRLRMEATVSERPPSSVNQTRGRYSFRADRRITALKILARERFGEQGEKLIRDWLAGEALEAWQQKEGSRGN